MLDKLICLCVWVLEKLVDKSLDKKVHVEPQIYPMIVDLPKYNQPAIVSSGYSKAIQDNSPELLSVYVVSKSFLQHPDIIGILDEGCMTRQ